MKPYCCSARVVRVCETASSSFKQCVSVAVLVMFTGSLQPHHKQPTITPVQALITCSTFMLFSDHLKLKLLVLCAFFLLQLHLKLSGFTILMPPKGQVGAVKSIYAKKLLLGFEGNVGFLLDKCLSINPPAVFTFQNQSILQITILSKYERFHSYQARTAHGEETETITIAFSSSSSFHFLHEDL